MSDTLVDNLEIDRTDSLHLSLRIENLSSNVESASTTQIKLHQDTLNAVRRLKETETPRSSQDAPNESDGNDDHSGDIHTATPSNLANDTLMSSKDNINTFRITMSEARGCHNWCSCNCHTRYSIKSLSVLKPLIGSLNIDCSNLPLLSQPCNEHACKRQSTSSVQMNYYFPPWLLPRVIGILYKASTNQGPEMTLRVPYIRPRGDAVFRCAVQGNVESMKSMLISREVSPHDISSSSGLSALQYAVEYSKPEVCRILLFAGADPYMEDKIQRNSFDLAWDKILSNSIEPALQDTFRQLFNDPEQLEKRQFPIIHKIVLGLVVKNLEEELTISTATINSRDCDGRTAISWAAARNDSQTVETLLNFGANPNIASFNGWTPLLWASKTRTTSSLKILLNAGADVNQRTSHLSTALHMAAIFQNDIEFLEALVRGGADMHARRSNGDTPLICAAEENRVRCMAYLLDHSANIEDVNYDGYSALLWVISNNSHEALELLLQRGANPNVKSNKHETILHIAARHADIATLRLLSKFNLLEVDIEAKNGDGLLARDIAQRRTGILDEWNAAFKDLTSVYKMSD